MARRSLPFEFSRRGYRCNLDPDERHLVRRLIGEVSELLTTMSADDPKMARLFPPAYLDEADESSQTEYQQFMRDELVASRLDTIMRVDSFLADDDRTDITEEDVDTFATALNSVRLVLGTLLGIDDEDDDASTTVTHSREMQLYDYLSWLLECAVSARMKGWEQDRGR